MLNKNECISLIRECFKKSEISPPENVGIPNMSLSQVDLCLDCVANILCNEGFEEDSKPNSYGLKLENVIDYLSHIRFSIIDGIDFVWEDR